jgi:hypothetical protein
LVTGWSDDVVEEKLALEVKKPPIFVVNGAGMGVVRLEDEDEGAEPMLLLGAGFTVVSTFHILLLPAWGVASLALDSIFHILNAPHPVAGFVSASCPVVMVGIGGSLTDSDSVTDDCVSAMNSRSAFTHVSDASRASLASNNSCLVSSNSALTAFISRRRASISSAGGSLGGRSNDSGDDARANMLEKRFELTGG